jgi:PIN domain nuclease of toxin-antitoxin system
VIVLDTHIWIWWLTLDDRSLKQGWRDAITNADTIAVSAISCFEVAWLVKRGRVEIPVTLDAVVRRRARLAVELPEHHRDPQDRIIIATAIANDTQLLSADGRFPDYEELDGRLIL